MKCTKVLTATLSAILLLAALTACGGAAINETLPQLPENAQLVFTQKIETASGQSVTYGSWKAPRNSEGTLVVEILCTGGSASDVKLEYTVEGSGGSAHLGSFSKPAIVEVEEFYTPGGEYFFTISRLKAFEGTLNLYLVPV